MNQETKLSRRQFLRLSAATVGAAALAGGMPRLADASAAVRTTQTRCSTRHADRSQPLRGLRQLPAGLRRGQQSKADHRRDAKAERQHFTFLEQR